MGEGREGKRPNLRLAFIRKIPLQEREIAVREEKWTFLVYNGEEERESPLFLFSLAQLSHLPARGEPFTSSPSPSIGIPPQKRAEEEEEDAPSRIGAVRKPANGLSESINA